MPLLELSELEGVEKPELIFSFVAPVGAAIKVLSLELQDALKDYGYDPEVVRLSSFLHDIELSVPPPPAHASEYERINTLMDLGDELREKVGGSEILALLAAATIAKRRPTEPPYALTGKAFILHQVKHPDEVTALRAVYGAAFHLIGISASVEKQVENLHVHGPMSQAEAKKLIDRDEGEESKHGQQVSRAFHHADVFIDVDSELVTAKRQLRRYVDLLFGATACGPTREEYGMFLAHAAALRSTDLSRQVGAAILSAERGEVLAVGCNEVPSARGGQYWGEEDRDCRDAVRGEDANQVIMQETLEEVVSKLGNHGDGEGDHSRSVDEAQNLLDGSRLLNLTEFGRAVHAEMEAILSAGRTGRSVVESVLYITTFPCHNCAKHIVASGIMRVVFVEPYPKSLAKRLHGDAIVFPGDEVDPKKVNFEAFSGVAPRMYSFLFSTVTPTGGRIRRKDLQGKFRLPPPKLRLSASHLTHVKREMLAAIAAGNLSKPPTEEVDS